MKGPRGTDLVKKCIERLKKGPHAGKAMPVSPDRLAGLQFIDGKPLPPSMRAFFAYDLSFESLYFRYDDDDDAIGFTNAGCFGYVEPRIDKVDMEEVAAEWLDGYADGELSKAKVVNSKGVEVKAGSYASLFQPEITADCYRLPHIGDQEHFLMVGTPDEKGEYPVLGVELEASYDEEERLLNVKKISAWIKYPTFDVYLADQIGVVDLGSDPWKDKDFAAEVKEQAKRNSFGK